MNIVETKIPDVTSSNINRAKEILVDNIVKNVYPLYDEVYTGKLNEKKDLFIKMKGIKLLLAKEKESIESLIHQHRKIKKISKILDRIKSLIASGLTYDGHLKHETVILLRIIDKLPEDKLNQQLNKTIQILTKRFAK
jgi:hypothetical protein